MRSDLVKGFLSTTLMTTLGAGLVAGVFIARPAIAQDTMPEGPGKAAAAAMAWVRSPASIAAPRTGPPPSAP